VIVVIAALLFFRNLQNKRRLLQAQAELQKQRIAELEIEKQFFAAQAVLKGQDEERTRLAKDLHDGLGGILSGAKYAFGNMKNYFIITQEGAEAFDKSMAMLDKSISELRAVSHNMMPEALVKFGLDTALKDYCSSIQQSGALQVTYQSFGITDDSIPKPSASVIYRIVQELLNNIIKHAAATTTLVQLVQKDNSLSITVEDNGRGFNKALLENAEGIGFKNIFNRITYLKGTVDFDTAPGKGTSVNIEIPQVA
jgi:signal transduction histidine kinase